MVRIVIAYIVLCLLTQKSAEAYIGVKIPLLFVIQKNYSYLCQPLFCGIGYFFTNKKQLI